MQKKTIDTLVMDIYNLFSPDGQELSEDLLNEFASSAKDAVKKSIEEARNGRSTGLRLSAIGKPDRQLWFDNNPEGTPKDTLLSNTVHQSQEPLRLSNGHSPNNLIKFLFGHIIESLLVYFIKQSGHQLDYAQETLDLCGVPGHTDGVLDGYPTDIKSASAYAYKMKFANRGLVKPGPESDTFGYVYQLKAYREALLAKYPDADIDTENVAWVAFNKETGEICVLKADVLELQAGSAAKRVQHVQRLVKKPEPPKEKCYPDVPEGKSGNRVLNKLCTWCQHKDRCWQDANGGTGLISYEYSTGPKYFTQIAKVPRVQRTDYEFTSEDEYPNN